jgi:fructose-bisphosphate aldolase class II
VLRTGVDALAVAIGTSHGAYKFNREPTGDILAMDVVKAIHERLPNTHLVMHGSSSVPQDLQDIFNLYGGAIPQTWGVPVREIQLGIKYGVRKINIDTDCRIAMVGQFRKVATEKKTEFDPRAFMKPAMASLTALCAQRFEEFGTAGQAPKLSPLPLKAMATRYAKGELDPVGASAHTLAA